MPIIQIIIIEICYIVCYKKVINSRDQIVYAIIFLINLAMFNIRTCFYVKIGSDSYLFHYHYQSLS